MKTASKKAYTAHQIRMISVESKRDPRSIAHYLRDASTVKPLVALSIREAIAKLVAAGLLAVSLLLAGCGSDAAPAAPEVTDAGGSLGAVYCPKALACDSRLVECLPQTGGSCAASELDTCLAAIEAATCDTLGEATATPECKACTPQL